MPIPRKFIVPMLLILAPLMAACSSSESDEPNVNVSQPPTTVEPPIDPPQLSEEQIKQNACNELGMTEQECSEADFDIVDSVAPPPTTGPEVNPDPCGNENMDPAQCLEDLWSPEEITDQDTRFANMEATSAALREMDATTCEATDAFEFLNIREFFEGDAERINENGSFFHYDCASGYWGWYHEAPQGRAAHSWTLVLPDNPVDLPYNDEGHFYMDLSSASGVPFGMQHPAYPQAVTLGSLNPGDTVCYSEHTSTYTVEGAELYGYYYENVMDEPVFYPILRVTNPDQVERELSMIDFGLVPNEFGLWADAFFTAGPC